MKTVGLITEYNPFHNGHKYHIEEAKRITGADYVVVVMSGNFVQRGAPAILDKYSRTQMALHCGADLVFELPVCYATASAEYFALGAVSLLDKLGIVDYLCFGSESGEIKDIKDIAELLFYRDSEVNEWLQQELRKGVTYPIARANAVSKLLQTMPESHIPPLLKEPNNILGIEYVKALLKLKSSILPVTIKRKASHYHDDNLSLTTNLHSASAIRKHHQITEHKDASDLLGIKMSMPPMVYSILEQNYQVTYPIFDDDISELLNYRLLFETKETLTNITDCTGFLADRILKQSNLNLSASELAMHIKAKNYTYTRISRVLLHILLQLKKENFESYKLVGYTPYARILGLKKSSSFLLRAIPQDENFVIITKLTTSMKTLSEPALNMLKEDILATHLYHQFVYKKFGTELTDEYRRGIILV